MTKARILLIGDYPGLLATRSLLLKEWNSDSTSSPDALEKIHSGSYELIIIGQSVSSGMAVEIVSAAKALKPPALVIAIRFPEDDTDLGAETHVVDMGAHPSWLSERVAFLLADRTLNS